MYDAMEMENTGKKEWKRRKKENLRETISIHVIKYLQALR